MGTHEWLKGRFQVEIHGLKQEFGARLIGGHDLCLLHMLNDLVGRHHGESGQVRDNGEGDEREGE